MNAEDVDFDGAINSLINRIQDLLEGEKMEIVMPALFALIGSSGFHTYTDMSKREFIAAAVESIETYYERTKKEHNNG